MKRQWSVQTDRMLVTIVSEPLQGAMRPGITRMMPDLDPPVVPTHVLVQRPGGGEPIRVEGDDVELLIWMLVKLRSSGVLAFGQRPPPMSGDFGVIGP